MQICLGPNQSVLIILFSGVLNFPMQVVWGLEIVSCLLRRPYFRESTFMGSIPSSYKIIDF